MPAAAFPADSLRRRVAAARARLVTAGIEPGEAGLDAELLLREALGWDRARFLAHEDSPLPPALEITFERLLVRRELREPISLVVGRREFWGLDFEVSRDVLTPRPETELILEEALACLRGEPSPSAPAIADVGTGSGCLAICLARELPSATVLATDTSGGALEVAGRNAFRHGVSDRVRFVRASLLGDEKGPLTLIVSNPPYVPTADLRNLPPEVREFEPMMALDGGSDGLAVVRELLEAAAAALVAGGWLVFEFGAGQEDTVLRAVQGSQMELERIRRDLQGIPRTAVTRLKTHNSKLKLERR